MKYDSALDIWSIGCVIYELFTGQFLFPGRSNNEMLKLMMDVKGPFAKKWLKRGRFVDQHFESDQNMSFAFYEDDPITRTRVRKVIPTPTGPKQSILQLLQKSSGGRGGGTDGDRLLLAQLADLLEKMLMLEPEKRIDPETALKHPFVMRKTPPAPPPSIKQG